jgi:ribosomal protein L23
MLKIKPKRQFRSLKNSLHHPVKSFLNSHISRWLAVFIIIGLVYLLFSSTAFRIQNIECVSLNQAPCDPNVVAELNRHINKLIFTVNTQEIKEKIKKADPIYSGVEIEAILPNTLKVTMNKKDFFANLQVSSNSASLIIDQDQIVVDKQPFPTPGTFTIIVSSADQYSVGDRLIDSNTLIAFEVADALRINYLSFNQIYFISNTEIIISLHDDKTAIVTGVGDISRQVTSLQLILSKATISPEPRVFDMRFDMPVLKY